MTQTIPETQKSLRSYKNLQTWNLNFQKKPNYPQKIKTQETLAQKSKTQ